MPKPTRNLWFLAPALSALLVAGALAQSMMLPTAADADPYHQAVAEVAEQTPIAVDGLEARPLEIPESSLKLLRPNVARSVMYTEPETGDTCQLLLIQGRDARDLDGHYPPRCYPNVYGHILEESIARQWQLDGMTLEGIEYTFATSSQPGAPRQIVLHSFVLPNGETTGNHGTMRRAAADYLRRHHGAAQIQLLFDEASTTQAQRDRLFERVMQAQMPLIQAILSGPNDRTPDP